MKKLIMFAGGTVVLFTFFGCLFVWAVWNDLRVSVLRLIGKHAKAKQVEHVADVALRQFCGVPEPGEGWD